MPEWPPSTKISSANPWSGLSRSPVESPRGNPDSSRKTTAKAPFAARALECKSAHKVRSEARHCPAELLTLTPGMLRPAAASCSAPSTVRSVRTFVRILHKYPALVQRYSCVALLAQKHDFRSAPSEARPLLLEHAHGHLEVFETLLVRLFGIAGVEIDESVPVHDRERWDKCGHDGNTTERQLRC